METNPLILTIDPSTSWPGYPSTFLGSACKSSCVAPWITGNAKATADSTTCTACSTVAKNRCSNKKRGWKTLGLTVYTTKKVVKQFFWGVQSLISWLVASIMSLSWVDVSSNRKPGVTWHKSSFPPNKIRNTAGKIGKHTSIYHLSIIFSPPPQKNATKIFPTVFLKLTPLSPLAHACCTCPSCTTGVHALTSVSNTPASQVIPQRWCFLRRTGWTWKRSKWRNMRFFLKPVTSS